jgi:quercetin dioxygenase-like cupin family protein
VIGEPIIRRGTTLVRRLRLAPGEAMPWHRDPYHRVSIVLSGEELEIQFSDGTESERVPVKPGQVEWDEPSNRVHRGVNVGAQPYEEVAIFFLDRPNAVAQPREE